jgi:hypothetical protein
MGLFGWLKRKNGDGPGAGLVAWRKAWAEALARTEAGEAGDLARALDALGLAEEEVEIEREMLEGLQQLQALRATLSGGLLPIVTTGHRVVAQDVCHFVAPASMPDDPAQPSGRLILTNVRAIFVGGARSTSVPWHAIARTSCADRDVVLVRPDRDTLYRFRCNSYADALCGELIARQLAAPRRSGGGSDRV